MRTQGLPQVKKWGRNRYAMMPCPDCDGALVVRHLFLEHVSRNHFRRWKELNLLFLEWLEERA